MRSNHRHDRPRGMSSRSGEQGRYGGERGSSGDNVERGRQDEGGYEPQSSYGMGQGGRDWDLDRDSPDSGRSGRYGQSSGRGWSEQSYRQGFNQGGQGGYSGGGYGQQGQRDLSQRKGPKGYVRSDERIKEDLCERLMQVEEFDLEDVSIEVKDGKVTLEGSVPERTMKHRIEDVACYCMGVKEVENRMRISRDQPARSDEQGSQAGSGSATSRGKREH